MVLAQYAAHLANVGVNVNRNHAMRRDVVGAHLHDFRGLHGEVVAARFGEHNERHRVGVGAVTLREEASHVAVRDECDGLAVAIHDGRRRNVVVDQQFHGIENRCILGQGEHVALHDAFEHGTLGVVGVGFGCIARFVFHENHGKHETDKAQHRGARERHIHAENTRMHGVGRAHAHVRCDRGNGDEQRRAERACHLAQGIIHRGAVVHEAIVERIHGPCGNGHVHERKREHAHCVQNGEVDQSGRVAQECECERREGEHARANEAQHARAVLVEKASGNGTHRAHHDGARQNDQA